VFNLDELSCEIMYNNYDKITINYPISDFVLKEKGNMTFASQMSCYF